MMKSTDKNMRLKMTTAILVASAASVFAQAEEQVSFLDHYEDTIIYGLVGVTLLIMIGVIIALNNMLMGEVQELRQKLKKARGEEVTASDIEPDLFGSIVKQMTDTVPIEAEDEIKLNHNYDGIEELDNNLPPWWKMLFYASIAWGVVYFAYYHIFDYGVLSGEEYNIEMAEAEIAREKYLEKVADLVNETNVTLLADASSLDVGKEIYLGKCAACHGQLGEGLVGPNFADNYWIHGGTIKDVFSTVKYGVPAKGMIPWQTQLKPLEMQQVSSYILTLQGTNPPNQKEPQGELMDGTGEEPDAAPTDTTTTADADVAVVLQRSKTYWGLFSR